ncbi:MAG: polysaccharide pyruvyl transferase family protein [Candidatus Altiarchaeota archaeon]|nr:polysaccharide pyruvyl transferase family protein [Candidatus Altiarchaeota archaeon]
MDLKNSNLNLFITKGHGSLFDLKYTAGFKLNQLELLDIPYRINRQLKGYHIPLCFPSVHSLIDGVGKRNILSFCTFTALAIIVSVDVLLYKILRKALFISEYLDQLRKIDVVHYVGGGYFADWLRKMLVYEFLVVLLLKVLNPDIRIVGTGLGIGPLQNKFNRFVFKLFAKNFNYLSVRENDSLKLLKDLGISSEAKVLGDDVILLTPYIQELKATQKKTAKNHVAFNLKNFPDMDYAKIEKNIKSNVLFLKSRGFDIGYYCFGKKPGPDDRELLDLFDREFIKNLRIHDPYEEGWSKFLQNLTQSRCGFGFGFHFSLILALTGVPSVIGYGGGYYRQKIQEGLSFYKNNLSVFNMEELSSSNLSDAINKSNLKKESADLSSMYEVMKSEYITLYENLVETHRK